MSIEELLQETLDERATRVAGDDDLARQVIRRARGRRGRRVLLGLFAFLVVAIVLALVISQSMSRGGRVVPDIRATAVPSVSATTSTSPLPGVTTAYRILQGPDGALTAADKLPAGSAVGTLPRVERRGSVTWFLASSGGHAQPDVSVALPSDVNGARTIVPALDGWVVQTVSASFTGGDADPGSKILLVSFTGKVTTMATGAIRSVAVSPVGDQVAHVETSERPTWSVSLVVQRAGTTTVLRRVPLTYGGPGSWPYRLLAWTGDGIVASNAATPTANGTVRVQESTVTDISPVTAVWTAPDDTSFTVASSGVGDQTCVYASSLPAFGGTPVACGPMSVVGALAEGGVLASMDDVSGATPRAVVIDTRAKTLTVVTVPAAIAAVGMGTVFPDGPGRVLVQDAQAKLWLRWNLVANTVETAALPDGTNSAISW
jgi:hypothetical protein